MHHDAPLLAAALKPVSPALGATVTVGLSAADGAANARRVLSVQAALLSHARHAVAATALANEIATQWQCQRVLVGVRRGDAIELLAVSHGGGDALVGDSFEPVAAAMDEATQQGCAVYLPSGPDDRMPIRLAHQRWQQRQGGSVLSLPLVHAGDVIGALACEWVAVREDLGPLALQIEDAAAFAGPVLNLLYEQERPWTQRLQRALARGWARQWNRADGRRPRGLIAALVALGLGLPALTLLPVDHQVAGRARVEGEQQRALAAPADGFVKAVHVRPGDTVRRGQLLVELADQDLLLDRQRWSSELAQQESAYAVAISRADRAQMVIAMARAEQARAQLAKADARLARARVVAPYDGLVIRGDLSQSIDAPVERGQPLLTVAPDDRYRIVVEIDERDVAAVRSGQHGALSLASLPWQRLPLTVTRVTPVARAADGRNVFEVEAAVADAAGEAGEPGEAGADGSGDVVRPGLEGVARITVGERSLAWIWTHRFVDWLRLQAWTWWG